MYLVDLPLIPLTRSDGRQQRVEARILAQKEVTVKTDLPRDHDRPSPVSTPASGATQDTDGGPGRNSQLYISQPSKLDGKYHCAFEGQSECFHEPTKLKCNYE